MTRQTLVKIDRMSRKGQTPEAIARVAHCSVRTAERVREMACAGHTLQALEAYIEKRSGFAIEVSKWSLSKLRAALRTNFVYYAKEREVIQAAFARKGGR